MDRFFARHNAAVQAGRALVQDDNSRYHGLQSLISKARDLYYAATSSNKESQIAAIMAIAKAIQDNSDNYAREAVLYGLDKVHTIALDLSYDYPLLDS